MIFYFKCNFGSCLFLPLFLLNSYLKSSKLKSYLWHIMQLTNYALKYFDVSRNESGTLCELCCSAWTAFVHWLETEWHPAPQKMLYLTQYKLYSQHKQYQQVLVDFSRAMLEMEIYKSDWFSHCFVFAGRKQLCAWSSLTGSFPWFLALKSITL